MSSYSGTKSPDASAESQASQDSTIEDEVASLTRKVDSRSKEVDARLDSLDIKLDQVMLMLSSFVPSKEHEPQMMRSPAPDVTVGFKDSVSDVTSDKVFAALAKDDQGYNLKGQPP